MKFRPGTDEGDYKIKIRNLTRDVHHLALCETAELLLYAAREAQTLEEVIRPALQRGDWVFSDRYVYSLIARAIVRGADPDWIKQVYSFSLRPDAVYYLRIEVPDLVPRVVGNGGFDYWESGMDMKSGHDIYDNFRAYQRQLLKEYAALADEFGFRVLDGRKPVTVIQDELRRQIGEFLQTSDVPPVRT